MFAHARIPFVFALALSAAAASPLAHAQAADQSDIVAAVHTADLDLTRAADVDRLRHRIALAAWSVCKAGHPDEWMQPGVQADCMAEAIRGAEAQTRTVLAHARNPARFAGATASH